MQQATMSEIETITKSDVSQEQQKSRILAFDFARGIAIIVMVVIHSIVFLGDPVLVTTIPGYIANTLICLLAAPVFTFIMGIMISYSSKTNTRILILRGLTILGIGYLLNLLRGVIPMEFGDWAGWIEEVDENPWIYLLEDDILQFAGIAFIIIALLKKLFRWNIIIAIAGTVLMLIAPYLWKIGSEEPISGYVLSLLFGGEHYNYFPVIPWIAFPMVGMYYGELLKKSFDKKKFFTISLFIGLAIIILGSFLLFFDGNDTATRWYKGAFRQGKLPPVVSIVFTGFLLTWIPICYYISTKLQNAPIFKPLYFWSKNVTWFYVLQWIIIGWACVLLPYLTWVQVGIAVLLTLFVTDRFMLSFVKKKAS